MFMKTAIGSFMPKLANMHAKNPSFLIYENTLLNITNGIAPINAYQKYLFNILIYLLNNSSKYKYII